MIVIEDGFNTLVYEIVNEIPPGYQRWNIGKHHPEGWIPLCKHKHLQPFEGAREIETDTLKTIRVIDVTDKNLL